MVRISNLLICITIRTSPYLRRGSSGFVFTGGSDDEELGRGFAVLAFGCIGPTIEGWWGGGGTKVVVGRRGGGGVGSMQAWGRMVGHRDSGRDENDGQLGSGKEHWRIRQQWPLETRMKGGCRSDERTNRR